MKTVSVVSTSENVSLLLIFKISTLPLGCYSENMSGFDP